MPFISIRSIIHMCVWPFGRHLIHFNELFIFSCFITQCARRYKIKKFFFWILQEYVIHLHLLPMIYNKTNIIIITQTSKHVVIITYHHHHHNNNKNKNQRRINEPKEKKFVPFHLFFIYILIRIVYVVFYIVKNVQSILDRMFVIVGLVVKLI